MMRKRLFLTALLALLTVSVGSVHLLFVDLPSLDRLTENMVVPSTKILARDGRLLYEITDPAGLHHTTLPLAEIPLACQQGTIAVEDSSFYTNPGIDIVGITRSLWINISGGEVIAGGSTITQQVARNMLLDPQERAQRTPLRKLRESILAWRLLQAYSKDEILELYLNQTYYGHLAYGLESAAQTYFGKSARDLNLAECALLVGLPQAPALFDPLTEPLAADDKQAIVIDLMVKNRMITEDEARLAKSEQLQYATTAFPIEAPHFVFYVWSLLEAAYPPEVLYSGLTVTTTLDLDLTQAAEEIMRRRLDKLADDSASVAHNATGAGLVAVDPHTGQVLAMVGSPDYFNEEISGAVNMAVAPRQPGSAIKPITYAAAFDTANCAAAPLVVGALPETACPWTAATMILDVHTPFVTKEGFSYAPQNYDRNFHGPVLVREALGGSLNIPAVKALSHVGLDTMLSLAGRMGITTLTDADRYGLSLTLGGGEVRLIDLTRAFGVFANGGFRANPVAVLKVVDANGNVLDEWKPSPGERVLDPKVAFLVTDILSDNNARLATFGPNSVLQIGRPAAVKTGTTTDFRDNWTVGYTPDMVVGVWVGNADNSPMVNISGVQGAGPIWHDFMRAALTGKPELQFTQPDGLVRAEVCAMSGLLPTEYCPLRRSEWFIDGTQPALLDYFYQPFNIDAATGLLASDSTPTERVITQVFLVLPPEAEAWARERGLPVPPAAGITGDKEGSPLHLTSPDDATIFNISPRLPLESQQIVFQAATSLSLQNVSFVLNGQVVATLDRAPYDYFWTLSPGQYQLEVIGTDPNGLVIYGDTIRFEVRP
jgi:penicillin-binding protein 1C